MHINTKFNIKSSGCLPLVNTITKINIEPQTI